MPTRKHFAAFIAAGVLISISAGAFSLLNGQRTAMSSFAGIAVTIFPATAIPLATPDVSIVSAPLEPLTAVTVTPVETPIAAPRAGQHVVKTGDSLWAIALAFGLPDIQGILAVNPGLNPDALTIDQVLNIPALDFVPPPQPTPALAQQGAHVKLDAGGLRLRNEPRVSDNVLTRLAQSAALEIVSRSSDGAWYEVVTAGNVRGWVQAQYVDIDPAAGVVVNRPALPGLRVAAADVAAAAGGPVASLATVPDAPVLVAPVAVVAAPLEIPALSLRHQRAGV